MQVWLVIIIYIINPTLVITTVLYAAIGVIMMELIAVKFIYRNVLWPAIVRKQDTICPTGVLAMVRLRRKTVFRIAARQDIRMLTADVR